MEEVAEVVVVICIFKSSFSCFNLPNAKIIDVCWGSNPEFCIPDKHLPKRATSSFYFVCLKAESHYEALAGLNSEIHLPMPPQWHIFLLFK